MASRVKEQLVLVGLASLLQTLSIPYCTLTIICYLPYHLHRDYPAGAGRVSSCIGNDSLVWNTINARMGWSCACTTTAAKLIFYKIITEQNLLSFMPKVTKSFSKLLWKKLLGSVQFQIKFWWGRNSTRWATESALYCELLANLRLYRWSNTGWFPSIGASGPLTRLQSLKPSPKSLRHCSSRSQFTPKGNTSSCHFISKGSSFMQYNVL